MVFFKKYCPVWVYDCVVAQTVSDFILYGVDLAQPCRKFASGLTEVFEEVALEELVRASELVVQFLIEEKINEAISSGGISKSVNKIKMLGDNQIAIEKLNETEKALENEINKNKDLAKEIDNTAIQMNKAAQELEKSVGKIESFESEKLALLKQQQELENQVDELKEEGEEREQTIKKLEEIKEKNKNAVQNYYLFNEEMVKINNKNLRIMTRYKFKDLNATKPMYVDCYIDFNKIAKLDLVDLNLGTANSDFNIDNKYIKSGFTENQFKDLKQNNCRFLN